MPIGVRALVVAACAALALPAGASAFTGYDPDNVTFSPAATADLSVGSGNCTFDTNLGTISGTGCPSARGGGANNTSVDGIGVYVLPSNMPGLQPDTMEFVMNSLTAASGATITKTGSNNLVIATYHDLTLNTGASVDVDGLGEAGGDPGDAGGGPGGGDHSVSSNCPVSGGGGSFGGLGGDGGNGVPSGGTYGSTDQSTYLNDGSGGGGSGTGTGCGAVGGGNGGGGIGLVAMGTLTIDGSVSADGTPTAPTDDLHDQGGPGGGSGGAILLISPHLVLANQSVAQAKGGYGYSTDKEFGSGGGGGSGGRITAVSDLTSNPFNFVATAGGLGGMADDGAGIGLDGGQGNGGSLGALAYVTVTGPSSKQAGQSAAFTAAAAAGHATFAWDFGDGATGTGANASHSYSAAGHYTVTATATITDSGQTVSGTRSINVTAKPATQPPPTTPATPAMPATPSQPVVHCVVPKLSGLSLRAARKKLSRAHCKLGKVKKPRLKKSQRHARLVVSRQSQRAGKKLANRASVSLTLAPKKPKHRKHRH